MTKELEKKKARHVKLCEEWNDLRRDFEYECIYGTTSSIDRMDARLRKKGRRIDELKSDIDFLEKWEKKKKVKKSS